jgi:putative endonuclease
MARNEWASGAVGSAREWHSRGHRFDPGLVHQFDSRAKRARRVGALSEPDLWRVEGLCRSLPPARSWQAIKVSVAKLPEFIYILRCADGSLYVGRAHDVPRRVGEHNSGHGASHTTLRRPVRLVYSESCASSAEASRRERQIKGWTRAKKEALIAGDLEKIHSLSRRHRL